MTVLGRFSGMFLAKRLIAHISSDRLANATQVIPLSTAISEVDIDGQALRYVQNATFRALVSSLLNVLLVQS